MMKTILKFPVYVEIDSENIDRSLVSLRAKEILYPHLLRYLASAKYRKEVLDKLSKLLGSTVDVTVLTEIDVLRKAGLFQEPSSTKVDNEKV